MRRLVVIMTLSIFLSSQCSAADSLWNWLPKLAERTRECVLSHKNKYPSFALLAVTAYTGPNVCIDDFVGDVIISREAGEGNQYSMIFANGYGQYWLMTTLHPKWYDLGDLPKANLCQKNGAKRYSISLRDATFKQACEVLRKIGVSLVVPDNEKPITETRRTFHLSNLPIRQVIGQTLALYKREGWQNGEQYIVLQKPIIVGMNQAEAEASLLATIKRELTRRGLSEIPWGNMSDQFFGQLALSINCLPSHSEKKTSWSLDDLPLDQQRKWRLLSIKSRDLNNISAICTVFRVLNSEQVAGPSSS